MAAATELATIACIRAACQELALSRASYYRKLHPGSPRRNVSLLDQHHISRSTNTTNRTNAAISCLIRLTRSPN